MLNQTIFEKLQNIDIHGRLFCVDVHPTCVTFMVCNIQNSYDKHWNAYVFEKILSDFNITDSLVWNIHDTACHYYYQVTGVNDAQLSH